MRLDNTFAFYILLIVLRPFTVLLHELGHGIPALLFTTKKVTLYIGSYGDTKKGFHFHIGRLELFFKFNPFLWKLGLCVPGNENISITRNIIIVLGGPLISLLVGSISAYFGLFADINPSLTSLLFAIAVSTLFDFITNIIPRKAPIKLDDGTEVFNDGMQLKQLWKYRKFPDEYAVGVKYYNNKDYALAAEEFEKVFKKGFDLRIIHQLTISSYLQVQDYANAQRVNDRYWNNYKEEYNSNDYTNSGLLKSFSGQYNKALLDYQNAIEMDPKNAFALNNRGYTYNLMEEYEKAIMDFELALSIEENFAYVLNNIGFAKIKLGLKNEGLVDLEKSMTLDGTNSYCYLNFGVYNYDQGQYEKALEYFRKAKELDEKTYLLDEYIEKVKKKLSL